MMIEKILVIGVGFLGKHILQELKNRNKKTIGTTFSKVSSNYIRLDISNQSDIEKCCNSIEPDLIINCAANNDIDLIEKNPSIGINVNAKGAENIAIVANKFGIKILHISTDSVFDGKLGMYKENDKPNPINAYANSKFLGEKSVTNNCKEHIIIRTNFYGENDESKYLFNSILTKLKQKESFIGFDDIKFTPLEVHNLSEIIIDLIETDFKGILHLSSNEIITKYHFCIRIAETFGFDKNLIKKGFFDQMNYLAKRPKNTSLDNTKSKQWIKTPFISLDEWLKKKGSIL